MNPRKRQAPAGRVRIIGGHLRGSVLEVPERDGLRPTPARLRETLFNWLQPVIAGAHCLDLFAGSGALGIEALSRGAASSLLVERDAGLAEALRGNLQRLGCAGGKVSCDQALAVLADAPAQPCDIVFVDPPFAGDHWAGVVEALQSSSWLAMQAWIYVEMPAHAGLEPPAAWVVHRQSRAGDVIGTLYRSQPGIR